MSEPDSQKRSLLEMFTGKNLKHLFLSLVATGLAGWAIGVAFDSQKRAEFMAMRYDAYLTISQFAPWNIVQRYVAIVFTQGNTYAEALAKKQEQQTLLFRGFACDLRGASSFSGSSSASMDNPCQPLEHPQGIRAFYLSAHVPFPLRFITAFFDLLLHALVDQGVIGFLVAATQVALGALLARLAIKTSKLKLNTVYSYLLGLPLVIFALGSLAAIPLWLVALVGLMALKASPLGALGAQGGAAFWCVHFLVEKTADEVAHAAIMKQLQRVVRD
jgi:hypothetical protein